MAAKKKVAKRATKRSNKKELVTMEELDKEMALMAEEESGKLSAEGSNKVSISGKRFTYKEMDMGNELRVIIMDSCFERTYYDRGYDPDDPSIPACFAIANSEMDEMTPSEASVCAQADNCNECPHDEWGSADVGRGKKCGTHVRLMMIDGDYENNYNANDIPELEPVMINVPATSIASWKRYVKNLSKTIRKPPLAVVTLVSFDSESDFPKLEFSMDSQITDPQILNAVMEKRKVTYDDLRYEYDPSNYTEPANKKRTVKRGSNKGKKKVSKKKFAR